MYCTNDNQDSVAQSSIKFKSQLLVNLKCKLISFTFQVQVQVRFNWHLN